MLIQINGFTWLISEVETSNSNLVANGVRCFGTTHYFTQDIFIDKYLPRDTKYSTLCHELGHAFIRETQLKPEKAFTEEMLCEFLGIYGRKIIKIADDYFAREEV